MEVKSNIKGGGSTTPEDILYAALVAKVGAAGLTPEKEYRITDFRTSYTIPNTTTFFTAEIEPIIVKAASVNTLYAEARSESYPQDILYYELVCTHKWGAILITADRGWIYYREDTLQQNKLDYDFRNAKWQRWNSQADGLGTWSILTDNTFPSQEFLTYQVYTQTFGNDFRVANKYTTPYTGSNYNNVFFGYCQGNIAPGLFYNNTFLGGTHHNNYGIRFAGNILSDEFIYNRIMDSFQNNTTQALFNNNTVGMDFTGFTFPPQLIMDSFIGGGGAGSGSDHPPIRLWQPSLLATPMVGAIEFFDGGEDFYGTNGSLVRKTFAYLESPTFTADTKTPPVDADSVMLMDSEAANILKKVTWDNIKTAIRAGLTIIQALGVKNADFTVDIANGAYATVTTGSAAVAMTLTSPASSTNSYKLTVAILQGSTPRVVTLKTADANVISSGGLMSSGDALPNSGANTLDVFEFQWTGTKWETYDARFDVKS